jgi:hypothetical protein
VRPSSPVELPLSDKQSEASVPVEMPGRKATEVSTALLASAVLLGSGGSIP